MSSVLLAYLIFAAAGLAAFFKWRPAIAALGVFFAGWLLLPVGNYPTGSAQAVFPYWITGLAVPSDMLLTKAWVAPVVALLGAVVFDLRTVLSLRPNAFDLPVLLWCLWPLAQWALLPQIDPAAPLSSLYLVGCWGAPWLLGRLYCASPQGQRLLLQAIVLSGLACLPLALIEGVAGPRLYAWIYEVHPFRIDGIDRYIGFRPLGFFENGNQYGLWIALSALAAVWLARSTVGAQRKPLTGAAAVLVLMALAAQSVGAILLLLIGVAVLFAAQRFNLKRLTLGALAACVLFGAVYVSGVVPVRQLATETTLGLAIVNGIKGVGRGSLTWRVSQDQKLLAPALAQPLTGSGRWDWWREQQVRPWGLGLLVIGQFGLIGLAACFGLLLAPAVRVAMQARPGAMWGPQGLPVVLAALAVLTVLDMLLNSFVFFPAIIVAGGIAVAAVPQAVRARRRAAGGDDRPVVSPGDARSRGA